jgi:UDP-2,3-diacylglucosamine pyrophosphatase LpxH
MASVLYFVSDLHFGGDGDLRICDFEDEFVAFLRDLATRGEDAELIIAGDTFGFWETTTVTGVAKLDKILADHQTIFDQLRKTGETVKITMMAGNHDYDLACDPDYAPKLAAYNIHLDPAISLSREMGGRKVWIEHGQQSDGFNASPDYGNLYALPVGYFITETVVAGASRLSELGRGNWLKDIRSVATEQIPDWILSNYFYREMALVIRGVLAVFLFLLVFTLGAVVAEVLRVAGVIDSNIFLNNPLFRSLGFVGNVLHLVILSNMVILFFMLVAAIPGMFVLHDIKNTLRRFQITGHHVSSVAVQSNQPYIDRARAVFAEHPEAAVYLFGHTHHAFLEQEPDGRVVANLGTWLKILHRVPVRFGYLPGVYFPTFRLNYFRIHAEDRRIVVSYVERAKKPARELTILQRIVTFGKKPPPPPPIPGKTVIEAG